MGILANAAPFSDMQLPVEVCPEAGTTKLPEVIIDCLPGWKIGQEITPGATRAKQIKERVEDAAQAVAAKLSLW